MSLTKVSYSMVAGAPLNILDFGAVAGADNTAAIIAAIAAATDGAGTKIILCNSFISSTITVDKSNIIFDSNLQDISYTADFTGGGGLPTYVNMFYVTANNVNFQNMTVNQGDFVPDLLLQRTIWFNSGSTDGAVLNCKFNNNLYIAIMATVGSSRVQIKGNTFINCRASSVTSGDYCITESNIVYNDTVPGGQDSVFSINSGNGSGIINNIIYNGPDCNAGGDVIDVVESTNVSITGNRIYGFKGGNGINLWNVGTGNVVGAIVADNIIDGGGYTATDPWVFISGTGATYTIIKNNILKNPPTNIVGSCGGIIIQGGYNVVDGNGIYLGNVGVNYGIGVINDTGPLDITNNKIYCNNFGVHFINTTNNAMTPIILSNNEYGGQMVFAYQSSSLIQNAPIWLENEKYLSASIIYWNIAKYNTLLSYFSSAQLPFSLKNNCVLYSAATPVTGTWQVGDNISQAVPTVGQPKGWMCTVAGTYSAATEAGTATSGSPTITAMADTSDFFVGDYIDSTAQFAVLTRLTILSKTASSITVNRNANGNGACTLSTTDPTWVSTGNL